MPLPAPPFPSLAWAHVSYPCYSLPPLVCGTRFQPAKYAVFSLRHPRPAPDRRTTPSGLSGSQETSACCAQERLRRVYRYFVLQKGPVRQTGGQHNRPERESVRGATAVFHLQILHSGVLEFCEHYRRNLIARRPLSNGPMSMLSGPQSLSQVHVTFFCTTLDNVIIA
jgi:hypothetical protein